MERTKIRAITPMTNNKQQHVVISALSVVWMRWEVEDVDDYSNQQYPRCICLQSVTRYISPHCLVSSHLLILGLIDTLC